MQMSEASQNPRRVMWWVRKFGEPLRETFTVADDTSDQFFDLLAEADNRRGGSSDNNDQSQGA